MGKYISDFTIHDSKSISHRYQSITLQAPESYDLSAIKPGQFIQIQTPDSANSTLLRRPISINNVDIENNRLTIIVARVGKGTNAICDHPTGQTLNIMWPLGNGFPCEDLDQTKSVLLIGGGVGIAPLLYLGKKLYANNIRTQFLLAARTATDLLPIDEFKQFGPVNISTDDGSLGQPGLVTANDALQQHFDRIYCCGPMPMMKAIAHICETRNIECYVSLENVMACGIGACLCCVEKTVKGNQCVCTDGPVFNINQLTW